MIVLITCLAIIALLFYQIVDRNFNYWKSRNVPSLKLIPFEKVFQVVCGKKNAHDIYKKIYKQCTTPYIGLYIHNLPALLIKDPDLIKKVLVKDFKKFSDRTVITTGSSDSIAYHGMFTANYTIWSYWRSKLMPAVSVPRIKLMMPMLQASALDLHEHLRKRLNKTLNVEEVAKKFTVDVQSMFVLGKQTGCLKSDNCNFFEIVEQLFTSKNHIKNVIASSFSNLPWVTKFFKQIDLETTPLNILSNTFMESFKEREKKSTVKNDLIDVFRELKFDPSGENYDKMVAQAIVLFQGGTSTPAVAIAFTLYELAVNTNFQDRLREEIRSVWESYQDFTYEALQTMKFLEMVLLETIRKYPGMAYITRVVTEDYTFEETGLTLEKNTSVIIPVSGLNYDCKIFPNPDQYDPERFSQENRQKIKQYTYMPFGEGPKSCLAQRMGLMMCKVSLCYILKDFAFERTPETSVPMQFDPSTLFLTSKSGIQLRIKKVEN